VKKLGQSILSCFVAGALAVTPIYLAALLLIKAAKSVSGIVRPLARILPHWFPAEHALSLLLVLFACFLVGLIIRVPAGRGTWQKLEDSFARKIPGYDLVRSLTHQLAGDTQDQGWKPALVEIEEALVPAFIIEELDDGRSTVFVPSVPTPFAGAIYILTPDRVHPLNVPFTQALKTVSRWGSGSKDLVAAMERSTPSTTGPAFTRTGPAG
jgi:uncharacterized membrane protein